MCVNALDLKFVQAGLVLRLQMFWWFWVLAIDSDVRTARVERVTSLLYSKLKAERCGAWICFVLADDSFADYQLAMVVVAFGLLSPQHWFYCCYDSSLLLDAILRYLSLLVAVRVSLAQKGYFACCALSQGVVSP